MIVEKQNNLELIKNLTLQKTDLYFQNFVQEIAPKIARWFLYFNKYKLRFEDNPLYATSEFLFVDEADAVFKAEDYTTVGDFLKEFTGEHLCFMTRSRQFILIHKTFRDELGIFIKRYVSDRLNDVLLETDDEILQDICPSFSKDYLFQDFCEYELNELIEDVENAVFNKVAALDFKQVVEWGMEKAPGLREQELKKLNERLKELEWPDWVLNSRKKGNATK